MGRLRWTASITPFCLLESSVQARMSNRSAGTCCSQPGESSSDICRLGRKPACLSVVESASPFETLVLQGPVPTVEHLLGIGDAARICARAVDRVESDRCDEIVDADLQRGRSRGRLMPHLLRSWCARSVGRCDRPQPDQGHPSDRTPKVSSRVCISI